MAPSPCGPRGLDPFYGIFPCCAVLDKKVIEEPVNRLFPVKRQAGMRRSAVVFIVGVVHPIVVHGWDLRLDLRTRHDPPLKIDGVRGTSFVFHDDALKLLVLHLAAINKRKGNWKKSSSTSFRSRDLRVTILWALRAIPAAPCCLGTTVSLSYYLWHGSWAQ